MSQLESVRKHLVKNGSITPMQALNLYGCYRLGARISDLRNAGVNISTERIKHKGSYYARYVYLGSNDNTSS